MTFRGFVTEGFVIPTGSMAPTLMGAHVLVHSDQTGSTFPVGLDVNFNARMLVDPMLPARSNPAGVNAGPYTRRMGDRILVLKCLYPFAQPHRFDVVVFKNPTDPVGDSSNYIKRLIGLPNEQVWITDGDVFSKADGESQFKIRRKPEHVQRAVWQPVYNSNYIPIDPDRYARDSGRIYESPWAPAEGEHAHWKIERRRSFQSDTDHPTALLWRNEVRAIDDWTAYNMLTPPARGLIPVSDVRIAAGVVPAQAGLITTLNIETRQHRFEFEIQQQSATIRMRSVTDDRVVHQWGPVNIHLPAAGKVFDVEFWHVDQSVAIFINGDRAVYGEYDDWSPLQRLQLATGKVGQTDVDALVDALPQPAHIRWEFSGSPVTLYRVRTDRDLYYRHDYLQMQQANPPFISGHAFATHPTDNPGILASDQFMMCGDNSQMSLDSRLWGNSAEIVRQQIDPHPFTVNRKLLLGKAWVVYFPAPYLIKEPDGYPVIPDFGRLRFIR
jgi:signal peptidase I